MIIQDINKFIKSLYPNKDFIGLHEPYFDKNEKIYLSECIDSTYVSSVGEFVNKVENNISNFLKCNHAVAVVNGTSGLQLAIKLIGVEQNDEVITQALSFIATSNAIRYNNADPIYIDVDHDTLGMSPEALDHFLKKNTIRKGKHLINKLSGKRIKACIPMHTFGLPCRIDTIIEICNEYNLPVIEDAAESFGSTYKGKHLGTFGKIGVLSFNGNKIITSGGGGAIISDDKAIAKKAKHLSTTAKVNHPFEYEHDELGFNFRMPNINAALLLAQLKKINLFLENKRQLSNLYDQFFEKFENIHYFKEINEGISNYWLNAVKMQSAQDKLKIIEEGMKENIMFRPIWKLAFELPMYKDCIRDNQKNAIELSSTVVNLPSSFRPNE